ncbi:hypothetical protein EMIT0357P_140092 [Pseudomonas marginalis]
MATDAASESWTYLLRFIGSSVRNQFWVGVMQAAFNMPTLMATAAT